MTEQPPDYVTQITAPGIHNEPALNYQMTQLSEDQIKAARNKFNKQLLQIVVLALTGVYIPTGEPNAEENQLSDWAASMADVPIVGDMIEILTGVEDGDLNDLGTWVLKFFNNPLSVLFPSAVPQLPPDRIDGVSGPTIQDDFTNTWNQFWDGIFRTSGSTGKTPADVGTAASDISTRTYNTQFSTETLAGFFNAPRTIPAWIGALTDEVTFPRDQVDGTTPPTLGQVVLIPVSITQDRPIEALKAGVAATTMTNLYVGLYDLDETTGDLAKVLDLGDRKANLDTAFGQQIFPLDEVITVQQGEIYYIAVLQVGGTVAAMHRKSLTFNLTNGLFPKFLGSTWATTGVGALPATIPDADVVSGTRFWGAMGNVTEAVAPGSVFLSDSFNRADSLNPGPNWTVRNSGIQISQNTAKGTNIFAANIASYNTRLTSLSQRVGYTVPASNASPTGNEVFLRGNGLGPRVSLNVFYNAGGPTREARIYTYPNTSYSNTTKILRASGAISNLAGDWTLEAVGTVYTAYKNGAGVCQWTDSGGAFPVTSGCTEVGMQASTSASYVDNMDDWIAQDL